VVIVLVALTSRWLHAEPALITTDGKPWTGTVPASGSRSVVVPKADPDALYSILVALEKPSTLADKDTLTVTIRDDKMTLAEMLLHQFNGDSYVLVRPTTEGRLLIECSSAAAKEVGLRVSIRRWDTPAAKVHNVEVEPNNTWQRAQPIRLNTVIFAHCDDRQLYPAQHDPRKGPVPPLTHYGQLMPANEARAAAEGEDWFTFEVTGKDPQLVYFVLDVLDREVPLDVSVWHLKASGGGKPSEKKLVPFVGGIDPTSDIVLETPAIDPHEVQTRLANKFTTRVLPPGQYYLRVEGNHPAYQLRTFTYEVPGAKKSLDEAVQARKSVRVALDYLVNAGDSWHANIPRMGGVQNRVMNIHAETAQCIACHPTHFTTRAHQLATENGYPVKQRPALKFLTERLYNNPRPFYGHEKEASWARMISASANVMSRLAYILNLHEHQVSREFRTSCLEGVAGYLKLYYKGRDQLPPNESNGNLPVVSTYEVAGHSWVVFDELFRRTKDKECADYRDRLRKLIEQDTFSKRKDDVRRPVMLDLCYQTADFVQMDAKAYADRIKKNCERILSYQRPDGSWSMLLSPKSESVRFQTGHCLWVLALAGYPPDHPQVHKGVEFLLKTQQPWGGWLDSSTYENFKTPFRETQFAVMALAQLYPNEDPKRGPEQAKGWQAGFPPLPEKLNLKNESLLLEQLDQIWERPGQGLLQDLGAALKHPEILVRQTAVEAAGRIVAPELLPATVKLLGDPSKVVRHSAAWALREYASRTGKGFKEIKAALASPEETTRRGAIRIFTQHFAYLTHDSDLGRKLLECLSDSDPQVRMLAARGAWQWFWWTKDLPLRAKIVDALLDRLAVEKHAYVLRNLREALYNVADENTRYLYNNWIPLLAQEADRDKAIKGQRGQMKMIGDRVAKALASDDPVLIDNVLAALGEFHLRRGGYNNAGRYGRIGNDIEQIQFYAESRDTLEPLLLKLLGHKNASIREHAAVAAFTLKGAGAKDLPFRWLDLYGDDSAAVRSVAKELQGAFPLPGGPKSAERLGPTLARLLASPYPEAQTAALTTVARVGGNLSKDEKLLGAVRQLLVSNDKNRLSTALSALPRFPALYNDKAVREAFVSALQSEEAPVRRAALEAALLTPALASDKTASFYVNRLLRSETPSNRHLLVEIVRANPSLASNLEIISIVSEALTAKEDTVRREALALVQKHPAMRQNPAVRLALKTLLDDPSERTRQIAEQLYEGKGKTPEQRDITKLLDYDYFVERVQPLFVKKGPDGQACALCHHTHTIFRLSRPGKDGTFTVEQSKQHYRSALRVIDLAHPEESLILRKPLSDARSEGVIDQKTISHGGGIRWTGSEDPAYRTLLAWINGAKLEKKK
jgi:HEAT repeat protein